MQQIPKYHANVTKALEVILWLADAHPEIDVYHLVKAVYFADKHHVAAYGRPICGDSYDAAPFGPLARVIYGLLRSQPIEMLALGGNGDPPFRIGEAHRVVGDRAPNRRLLSDSDVEALRIGLDHVRARSFGDLYEETHADPAYLRAEGGVIDYRDFIDDADAEADEKRAFIEESARETVF
jgi:hypothetical protein